MEVTGYLRILRQRWRLVLLPCVVAVAVAVNTIPQEQHHGPVVRSGLRRSWTTRVNPSCWRTR